MTSSKSNTKREVYSSKTMFKKKNKKKTQMRNPTLHLKELKKEHTKPKVSRRKEIVIKIGAKINREFNESTKLKELVFRKDQN